MKDVKVEANGKEEWTLYDDKYLKSMKDNWAEIVRDMSRVNAYPTVLIYESLAVADDHKGD